MKIINFVCLAIGGFIALGAQASEVPAPETSSLENSNSLEGLNRLRLSFGYNFTTGSTGLADTPWDLNEISAGLEINHAITDHLELGLSASRVFIAADSRIYLIGLTPSYAYTQNKIHYYFGAFIGLMDIYNKVYRLVSVPQGSTPGTDIENITVSGTRFAFGPRVGVDYQLFGDLFAHGSAQYVTAFGPDSRLGAFSLAAGVGYEW